jgi:hypothetical protein
MPWPVLLGLLLLSLQRQTRLLHSFKRVLLQTQ